MLHIQKTIHVFVRHCETSDNSIHKRRPGWFNKEENFKNLLATADANTKITVILDVAKIQDPKAHFSYKYAEDGVKTVEMCGGTDAHSFLNILDYICNQDLPSHDIVYILEDDYAHRPGWTKVLREAFDKNIAHYVTLYDHPDKYSEMYNTLESKIVVTNSCHWRTTPSTTNTYAMLVSTIKEHKDIHAKFSDKNVGFTFDHYKFLHLSSMGYKLVSSIPAYSTHVEDGQLSPIVRWCDIVKQYQ